MFRVPPIVARSLLALTVLLLFGGNAATTSAAADERPNILLILSDDHSVPYLSCYGSQDVQTPNLDRFAAGGVRFNHFYTAAPQCVPSRVAMLTGRSPVAARMTRFNSPLPRDVVSLPELLGQAGYFTGICGRSFHLDGPSSGRQAGLVENIYRQHELRSFAERVDYLDPNSPSGQRPGKVREFFSQRPEGRPWFLWVNFNDPHHPWDDNAARLGPDPASVKLPTEWPDLPGLRSDLSRYCGEVTRMDGEFQGILDAVAEHADLDQTLVIFAGDNGYALPHGKGSLYDPGLNTPLLVAWPARAEPGRVSDVLVSGEDITPTCLAAAGVAAPSAMTGRSFLPLLVGQQFEPRKYIFAERGVHGSATYNEGTNAAGYDLSRCVRSDRYKLIYNCTPWMTYSPVDSARDPGWRAMVAAHEAETLAPEFVRAYFTHPRPIYELYDLESDPGELVNLMGQRRLKEVERELRAALIEKMIVDFDYLPLPTP